MNSFVDQFTDVIKEVAGTVRFFEDEECKIDDPEIAETPYGIKITYDLPVRSKYDKANKFYIHLKDPMRIQKGKRWSQCMYMYYVLEHKRSQRGFRENYDEYILALDGDVLFHPSALITLLTRIRRTPKVGAACGRIHATG